MKLIQTTSLKPNQTIGRPVYDINGRILVNKNIELTPQLINRLVKLGVLYVYIQDSDVGEIDISSPISDETKRKSVLGVHNVYESLKESDMLHNTFVIEKSKKQLDSVITTIIDELDKDNHVLSLVTDFFDFDNHTFAHSVNVTTYSLAIGKELGLSKHELELLGLGALLHDVGKMFVPMEVLNKPGRLTDEEFELIKKHPVDGYNLLRNVRGLPLSISHCALQHHERLDGRGYPLGVTSEKITAFSKIIAVADVFDATTSNRVYRSAMLPHESMEILYAGVDSQFEISIVEAFKRVVVMYPNGITVRLSNGDEGVVVGQNKGQSDRPIVKILEQKGVKCEKPFIIDLGETLNVIITNCYAS